MSDSPDPKTTAEGDREHFEEIRAHYDEYGFDGPTELDHERNRIIGFLLDAYDRLHVENQHLRDTDRDRDMQLERLEAECDRLGAASVAIGESWRKRTEKAEEELAAVLSSPTRPAEQPQIVCLCGSSKFHAEHDAVNRELTMAGYIVLGLGSFSHSDGHSVTDAEKAALDALHLAKIDLADEVFVVNPGGYIGTSTSNEIAYATNSGKTVRYLVDAGADVPRRPAEQPQDDGDVRAVALGAEIATTERITSLLYDLDERTKERDEARELACVSLDILKNVSDEPMRELYGVDDFGEMPDWFTGYGKPGGKR